MTPVTQEALPMSESDLDAVYTNLCTTMTQLGEPQAPLFLARFALLAIDRISDARTSQQLIAAAAEGIGAAANQ